MGTEGIIEILQVAPVSTEPREDLQTYSKRITKLVLDNLNRPDDPPDYPALVTPSFLKSLTRKWR